MQALIDHLKADNDIVIFDSPPAMVVTDASVLATRVDGVVLVTDAGHTRREMAVRARDTLRKVGGNLLGAVVNRLSSRAGGYYSYYYYYYYSADGDGDGKRKRKHKRHSEDGGRQPWLRSLFGRSRANGRRERDESGGDFGLDQAPSQRGARMFSVRRRSTSGGARLTNGQR